MGQIAYVITHNFSVESYDLSSSISPKPAIPIRMLLAENVPALRARIQTVTRRPPGWEHLKPGDVFEIVTENWMVGYPGNVRPLARVEIVSVRPEALRRLLDEPAYGAEEMVREGHSPLTSVRAQVAARLSRQKNLTLDTPLTRIEFKYL